MNDLNSSDLEEFARFARMMEHYGNDQGYSVRVAVFKDQAKLESKEFSPTRLRRVLEAFYHTIKVEEK